MKSVDSFSFCITKDISPVVVALDYNNLNNLLEFVDHIYQSDCRLKIGKEVFTLFGPQIIQVLQKRGFDIFLDLKFFDTPNTIARAIASSAELGVWMVNVHAIGGEKMMLAAREALLPYGKDAPLLIAVTVLTSMSTKDLQDIYVLLSHSEYVERLAQLTKNCGLDGIVCSAQEAAKLKRKFGNSFKLITPGIRPKGYDAGGHIHVMTPEKARKAGVDYMVIGRPITQSANPFQTLKEINKSIRYYHR